MKGKLVRDKIPELIRAGGREPQVRILEQDEYRHFLEQKLDEETAEFHEEQNLEELADILEVVLALAELHGGREALMDAYQKKHAQRGGFQDRVFLIQQEPEVCQ